jgi:hypothetical protein
VSVDALVAALKRRSYVVADQQDVNMAHLLLLERMAPQ